MSDTVYDETREDVLKYAADRGFPVTPDQLDYYRERGVMPASYGNPLGFMLGKESIYPRGSGEQLVALRKLLARDRRLTHAGWRLWWDGYPVQTRFIRATLNAMAMKWERNFTALSEDGMLSEQALALVEAANHARLPISELRRWRKRIGGEKFAAMACVVLEEMTGTFEGFIGDDAAYMLAAFGNPDREGELLDKKDRAALPGLFKETGLEIAEASQWDNIRAALEEITDDDLLEAHTEQRAWFQLMAYLQPLVQRVFGRQYADLFAMFHKEIARYPYAQMGNFLLWLAQRRLPASQMYRQVLRIYAADPQTFEALMNAAIEQFIAARMPPARLQPSEGATHGKVSSICETSLHPPSPP